MAKFCFRDVAFPSRCTQVWYSGNPPWAGLWGCVRRCTAGSVSLTIRKRSAGLSAALCAGLFLWFSQVLPARLPKQWHMQGPYFHPMWSGKHPRSRNLVRGSRPFWNVTLIVYNMQSFNTILAGDRFITGHGTRWTRQHCQSEQS